MDILLALIAFCSTAALAVTFGSLMVEQRKLRAATLTIYKLVDQLDFTGGVLDALWEDGPECVSTRTVEKAIGDATDLVNEEYV